MTRKIFLALLLLWTWVIVIFHLGDFTPPPHDRVHGVADASHQQIWIPKTKFGVNQLVLTGTPYERGLAAGRLTKNLLFKEEDSLTSKLRQFFPSDFILKPLQVLMIRWFWGADRFFEPWALEEMDGVAQSASPQFESFGNGFNRQLYYHGLHEVGQMMVDQKGDDMGCTVAAFPFQDKWVLGRNFDFEGGPAFDEDKIVKWVFPDQGNAYVSVVWAGMVGAVTGVNDHGLYLSLNAAGARDFRRYGTPTTLVITKALQFAKSVDEAVEIIREAETFITDIFVVSDAETGRFYRIEKSPHHTEVIAVHESHVVTNHLISDFWKNDSINLFRRNDLTSALREQRGQELLAKMTMDLPKLKSAREVDFRILAIMRDKGKDQQKKQLALGNRSAIDGLIATHSVIYDETDNQLYVSQGPSLAGAYTGFDLRESFRTHKPVVIEGLARDPIVSDLNYQNVKLALQELSDAEKLIKKKNCPLALPLLDAARLHDSESYNYSMAMGDYYDCTGNQVQAVADWKEALARSPAYSAERRYLKLKVGNP